MYNSIAGGLRPFIVPKPIPITFPSPGRWDDTAYVVVKRIVKKKKRLSLTYRKIK